MDDKRDPLFLDEMLSALPTASPESRRIIETILRTLLYETREPMSRVLFTRDLYESLVRIVEHRTPDREEWIETLGFFRETIELEAELREAPTTWDRVKSFFALMAGI